MATFLDTTRAGRSGAAFESGLYSNLSVFSVGAYGGVGGGAPTAVADNAAIVRALAAKESAGGGIVFFPEGDWHFTTVYDPGDLTVIEGAGAATVMRQTVDATRLWSWTGAARSYVAFRHFKAVGMWEANQTLGGDNDRLIAVNDYDTVIFDDVEAWYCRQMSLTANACDDVTATGCRVFYSARDAINLAGSSSCKVVGNTIRHGYDDAIAIHTRETDGNPPGEGHIVSHNQIEDSFGIKVLGAVKTVVSGNTIRRPKGYGVFLSVDGTEGVNDLTDVEVTGNVITDVINGNLVGAGDVSYGVYVANDDTDFARPVVPTSPTITKPEGLSYLSNDSAAQNAGAQRIRIHGNIIARTLPQVALYADWGYGECFTASGWENPVMSSWVMSRGVSLGGAVLSASVMHNDIELVDVCISGEQLGHLEELRVVGNRMARFNQGVALDTGAQLLYGRCHVHGNEFDGDPYFEHAQRAANGKWNDSSTPCAIWAHNFNGWNVHGNSFRNLAKDAHQGTTPYAGFGPNVYYMQPASGMSLASAANADNAGIRNPGWVWVPGTRIVWEVSDPTHADYGKTLSNQVWWGAIPDSDYWVAGQTVLSASTTESGSASSKYTVIGWRRLTTGNAHVLNTDWRELRALTGN